MISTNGGTIGHEVAPERVGGDDDDDGFAVLGRTVGIRALARNVSGVVDDVTNSGLPVILTKHGRPVAAIVPIGAATRRRGNSGSRGAGSSGPRGGAAIAARVALR